MSKVSDGLWMFLVWLFGPREKSFSLVDRTFRELPDEGRAAITYAFRLPPMEGYRVKSVEAKVDMFHWCPSDLSLYLEYGGRVGQLVWGQESEGAFYRPAETYAFAGMAGGEEMKFVIDDEVDDDGGWVRSVQVKVVFYKEGSYEATVLYRNLDEVTAVEQARALLQKAKLRRQRIAEKVLPSTTQGASD